MTQKIIITGGAGNLAHHTIPYLLKNGHSVRLASRQERRANIPAEVEWTRTSFETGEGVEEAVHGVDTIMHMASDPRNSHRIDVEGTRKLLGAAKSAGVSHFFYISIVGIEHFPDFEYYKSKLAAEQLIESSGMPYTILRATQFHDLLDLYFLPLAFRYPLVALVPTDFKYQVIEIDEVAKHMADLVCGEPSGHVSDIGGPQVLTMGKLARTWAKARNIHKPILHLPMFGSTPSGFRQGLLTCPDQKFGTRTWGEYLTKKYISKSDWQSDLHAGETNFEKVNNK